MAGTRDIADPAGKSAGSTRRLRTDGRAAAAGPIGKFFVTG